MRISVVIPVFNASRTLGECLRALAAQGYADFEVILVDNNSADSSAASIRDFLAAHPHFSGRLLCEPAQGATIARNTGARAATGEIIANIDPDCLPTSSWLSDLAEAFADGEVAAVAGNIDTRPPENVLEIFSALFTLPGRASAEVHRQYTLTRGGFATANLAMRRTWFEELGGFDESINYRGVGIGEDHDILARLYRRGGILKAIPRATVFHWHRSTLRGIIRQGFLFGMAHALLADRHGRKGVLLSAAGKDFTLPFPVKGWVEGNSLDKKVALLFSLGLFHPALFAILPCYLCLQIVKMGGRLRGKGFRPNWGVSAVLLALLLLKTAAITVGRVRGSFLQKVLCF